MLMNFRSSRIASHTTSAALGLLLVSLGLFQSACHRTEGKAIEVIPKATSNVYWQAVHAGAEAAGKDFHYQIIWDGPAQETQYDREASIVEDAVNRGVDAIVLAPSHRDALVPPVRQALAAKIPVSIIDSGINLPPSDYVSYVATDNREGGHMLAEALGQMLHGHGEVGEVAVAPGSVSTVEREKGFEDELKSRFPGVHIVEMRYGQSDVARARAVAEDILTAHPGITAMFASSEASLVGTLQALKGRSLEGKVKLVGFDINPLLLAGMKEGTVQALILQDPYQIGYQGVVTAVDALTGKPVAKTIHTPVRLVTQKNLNQPEIQTLLKQSGAE